MGWQQCCQVPVISFYKNGGLHALSPVKVSVRLVWGGRNGSQGPGAAPRAEQQLAQRIAESAEGSESGNRANR